MKKKLQLLLMVVVFAAPVLVALALQTPWFHYDPQATRNHGKLFQPPPLLSGWLTREAPTQPTWTMAFVADAQCDAECAAALDLLQRVWAAQGQERDRVQLLYSMPADAAAPAGLDPHWHSAVRDGSALPAEARVVLIDPEGYGATWYGADFDGTALRKDLRHLLKWSKSGR